MLTFLFLGPKASGSGNCLPKYPGFEYDVFNLIRDYFINLEEPLIPFDYYKLLLSTFDSYWQENSGRKMPSFIKCNSALLKETSMSEPKNDINLPKNCVYETAFSGREPVTKIVPIDELSIVLPNYFPISSMNIITQHNFKSVISPFNNSTTSNTFRALSTMPRTSSKLRSQQLQCQFSNSTPQGTKNGQMMSDILCLDSPPESGEYMLGKDMSQERQYHSLHRNQKNSVKSNIHQIASPLAQHSNTANKHYTLLQLILCTLPSSNRRHLQLLLRLFYKIIRNKELCLLTKDSVALKEHVRLYFIFRHYSNHFSFTSDCQNFYKIYFQK